MESGTVPPGYVGPWPIKEQKAWECPRCHKVNAPHIDQCSCDAAGSNVGSGSPFRTYGGS